MITTEEVLLQQLNSFLQQFRELNLSFQQGKENYEEMENVIGAFTSFVLNRDYEILWESVQQNSDLRFSSIVSQLREQSAYCVWAMEKHRAAELLKNRNEIADYFSNIESCIETEFGSFEISSDSKVLMIGSGAFPMTPLLIAERTGAEVVGIDIDPEANELARQVITLLGDSLDIRIEQVTVDQLPFTREATHIVFASTIKEKFQLLSQLHALSREDVVIAMRYGDGLKSLFNYPLQDVDSSQWTMVHNVSQPQQVFDIALYRKSEQ
ncbi:nicotianamine synthase family protein [Paenibacillus lemnae]|uniref:Methyltransferase domain-containing protein n=1 Tax=Paenibacillus lemnae TaxID=1330551 RepID=A0A848MC85_PAELE|nr:nicotianamine synthase family protein [Paenibacillus lemnae]NMO97663.1 methyltransferase domain-containing protein [Paenibacillus lemnae]